MLHSNRSNAWLDVHFCLASGNFTLDFSSSKRYTCFIRITCVDLSCMICMVPFLFVWTVRGAVANTFPASIITGSPSSLDL